MTYKILTVDIPRLIGVTTIGEVYVNGELKHQYLHNGYPTVKIAGKAFKVHRLVAKAFIPNPFAYPNINHKNGVRTDNNVCNLEWCTQRQNVHHALRTGLHPNPETPVRGEDVLTGEVLVFVSQAQAASSTKAAQPNINKCLAGLRKTAGGFTWEYA